MSNSMNLSRLSILFYNKKQLKKLSDGNRKLECARKESPSQAFVVLKPFGELHGEANDV